MSSFGEDSITYTILLIKDIYGNYKDYRISSHCHKSDLPEIYDSTLYDKLRNIQLLNNIILVKAGETTNFNIIVEIDYFEGKEPFNVGIF